MADRKRYVVTVGGGRSLADVEQDLAAAGLAVEQSLGEIGVVIGTAPQDVRAALGQVAGVSDVAEDNTIDIGPPGGPDTW